MIVLTPKFVGYPASFPVPRISQTLAIDYGVKRSTEQGFADQGRIYGSNPTTGTLSFLIEHSLFIDWSRWMDTYAVTRWIILPMVSQYAGWGNDGSPIVRETCRVGDFTQTNIGGKWMEVTANVEIMPQDIGESLPGTGGPVVPPALPGPAIGDWIIAGDATNPSPDWIIARDSTNPATDTITSGDAVTPSATV